MYSVFISYSFYNNIMISFLILEKTIPLIISLFPFLILNKDTPSLPLLTFISLTIPQTHYSNSFRSFIFYLRTFISILFYAILLLHIYISDLPFSIQTQILKNWLNSETCQMETYISSNSSLSQVHVDLVP
jgi:hypothetical protein